MHSVSHTTHSVDYCTCMLEIYLLFYSYIYICQKIYTHISIYTKIHIYIHYIYIYTLYIYLYIDIQTYVCIFICMYVYRYMCVYIHTHIHTYAYVCIVFSWSVCVYVCARACACVCVHVCMCVRFPVVLHQQTTFGHLFGVFVVFTKTRGCSQVDAETSLPVNLGLVWRRVKWSQISVCFDVMPSPIALPSKVRASLAIASPTRIRAPLANWMLTGARCGHHAKVTLETFQRVSKEAAPPQDPHGLQHARRLATTKRSNSRVLACLATAGVKRWTQVWDFRERQCVRWLLSAVKWLHECPK